jgi:hypothetical protein
VLLTLVDAWPAYLMHCHRNWLTSPFDGLLRKGFLELSDGKEHYQIFRVHPYTLSRADRILDIVPENTRRQTVGVKPPWERSRRIETPLLHWQNFQPGVPMLKLDTEAELAALHTGNVKESLYLEYKASDAVDKKDDKKKLEIARDVSAFANSMGGQIVYAMTEHEHEPTGLDQGIDPKTYPTLWFDQILQQHITPNLMGLDIKHVPLASGNVAVRISVPPGTGDPHQVSDGKYYRRHNFNRLAMDHYEIKGLFYRTTTPDLFVEFALRRGDNTSIEFGGGEEMSQRVPLQMFINNRSAQPAFHTVVQIGIHSDIAIINLNGFSKVGRTGKGKDAQDWVDFKIMPRNNLPIFKEVSFTLPTIDLGFHSQLLQAVHRFKLSVKTITPGQITSADWYLHQEGQHLTLLHPGHPLAR